MTRLRGSSSVGERLIEKVPHGHWKTTTLIAAPDHRGIRSVTTVDAGIDGDVFVSFCVRVLAPKLTPGDQVMDNLSAHKASGACVRRLNRRAR